LKIAEFSVIEARLSRELTAISINGFEADLTGAAMNRLLFTLAAALAVISLTRSTSAQVSKPINDECPPETYKNSDRNCVERPTIPHDKGATAICQDGDYSYSQHGTGTCSRNGGVRLWLRQ
jgi:Protein of unknown function (DUF3761)